MKSEKFRWGSPCGEEFGVMNRLLVKINRLKTMAKQPKKTPEKPAKAVRFVENKESQEVEGEVDKTLYKEQLEKVKEAEKHYSG